ncbi:MAG: hypothetical protein L6V93_05615 [Clostridiales bacterium]|nr:MAG: hypothetical protein L6V93_05615 [Clostridiales bacterium]
MKDNLSFMKDFKPLIEKESDTIQSVCDIFKPQKIVLNADKCENICPQYLKIRKLSEDAARTLEKNL